jgi:SOS-response transcriptional repressor LexA
MENQFPAALRDALDATGMSAYRLAKGSGLSEGFISNLLSGKRNPAAETLVKIAVVFPVEVTQKLRLAVGQDALAALGITDTEATPPVAESESVRQVVDHLTPLDRQGLRRLPRFESVACGWGALADEHPVDWDTWPEAIAKNADHTVVARGDSMSDAGISDGDLVFVRKTQAKPRQIPSGTSVIAHCGDGQYICKRLSHDRHISWLQGVIDGHMVPIYFHEHPQLRVVGIVTGVFKDMG